MRNLIFAVILISFLIPIVNASDIIYNNPLIPHLIKEPIVTSSVSNNTIGNVSYALDSDKLDGLHANQIANNPFDQSLNTTDTPRFTGLTLDGDLNLGYGIPLTPRNIHFLNNIYDADDLLVFETNDRSFTDVYGTKVLALNDVASRGYYINFESEEAAMPPTNFYGFIRLFGHEIENVSVISDASQITSVDIDNRTLVDNARDIIMSWKSNLLEMYKNINMGENDITNVSEISNHVSSSSVYAVSLDGSNDYVTIPATDFPYDDVDKSISFWFKTSDPMTGGEASIFNVGDSCNAGWAIMQSGNVLKYSYCGIIGVLGTTTIDDGDWHNLVFTFNATSDNLTIYLDGAGEFDITDANMGSTGNDVPTIGFGAWSGGPAYFHGEIDEINIWKRTLSTTEAVGLYNSQTGVYGDVATPPFDNALFSGYHFDDGTGTNADDFVGTNDGTLQNGATWVAGFIAIPAGTLLKIIAYNYDGIRQLFGDDLVPTIIKGKTITFSNNINAPNICYSNGTGCDIFNQSLNTGDSVNFSTIIIKKPSIKYPTWISNLGVFPNFYLRGDEVSDAYIVLESRNVVSFYMSHLDSDNNSNSLYNYVSDGNDGFSDKGDIIYETLGIDENGGIIYENKHFYLDASNGDTIFLKDITQTNGNASLNTYGGGMWMHNDSGLAGTFNTSYQRIYFDTADNVNGFKFYNSSLELLTDGGMYRTQWKAEGVGKNNHIYHAYIYVNELQMNNTIGHTIGTAGEDIHMEGFGYVRLTAGDNVTLRIADISAGGGDGFQKDANVNLMKAWN